MATSSIPAAIDYLYDTVTALPQCQPPVVVCDGWPDQPGQAGIVIGITPDDPTTDDEVTHGQLGAQTQWEEYAIPCVIWAKTGGSGHTAMKRARDAAFVILNALDSHLRTPVGRTLGGALRSGSAIAANVTIRQTGTADEAGEGRMAEIRFAVVCKSRSEA